MFNRQNKGLFLQGLLALVAFTIVITIVLPGEILNTFHLKEILLATCGAIVVLVTLYLNYNIFQPLKNASQITKEMAKGNLDSDLNAIAQLGEITQNLEKIKSDFVEFSDFVHSVGEGKLDKEIHSLSKEEGLGKAMLDMQNKLQTFSKEDEKRRWQTAGIAQIGESLRKHQNLDTKEISLKFLQEIIPYVSLNQGGVFILMDDEDEKYLELEACYAFSKKKYLEKKIGFGKGLVGQCIKEGEFIHLTEVPENYVSITSGLGEAPPRSILLMPIKYNEESYGVLEVAGFKKIQDYEILFLQKICESFGSIISNAKAAEKTKKMLETSEAMALELKTKEEILRGNTEELYSTQEELNKRLKQIEKESKLTQSIVDAVNKTNAAIELDLEGNILEVNDMYLSLMEYSKSEVIGRKEKDFIASGEVESQRYDMMWESIRTGAFNSGEFKRISKRGKELWLSGTYSPILDVEGKPLKIIQLAQFTTEQKEKELEFSNKIQALNHSVYSLEFNINGLIHSTNSLFQKEFGYKRSELVNKSFVDLLATNEEGLKETINVNDLVAEGTFISKILRFKTKDDRSKTFICNFSPIKNLAGELCKIMVIMIDFTEQDRLQDEMQYMLISEKRNKAALQLSSVTSTVFNKRFADTFFAISEEYDYSEFLFLLRNKRNIPSIMLDKTGTVDFITTASADVLGVNVENVEGKKIYDFFNFSDQEELNIFKNMITKPGINQVKLRIIDKKEKVIKLNIWLIPDYLEADKYNNLHMLILNINIPDNPPLDSQTMDK